MVVTITVRYLSGSQAVPSVASNSHHTSKSELGFFISPQSEVWSQPVDWKIWVVGGWHQHRYNYYKEMILTLQISENQPWLPIINWETPSLPLASPAVVDKISVKISYWCHDQITKNFSIHVAALPFSNGAWRVILKYFLLSKFYQTPDKEDGEGGAYLNKRYSSNLTCIFETDGELFTTKTRSTIC